MRLPPGLAERARRVAAGDLLPVPLRRAATVVLLRDGPDGPEAYLLRRHAHMAFVPGTTVFPGGGVDPRDADAGTAAGWVGPTPQEWGERLGCDPGTAQALVCAAVRELYEEAGVLLAGPDADSVVPDPLDREEGEADRRALVERRLALSDLLAARGLRLRSDLLVAWDHWVTPRFEERRYDTTFFLAALPGDQRARDVSGEADAAGWTRPADALEDARAGRTSLLPPTRATLAALADVASVAAALAAAGGRRLDPSIPGWVDDGTDVRLVLPGEPGFPGDDPGLEPGPAP